MGDRGNIAITQPGTDVPLYLYTHWDGSEIPQTLAKALDKGRDRWSDPSYLTRIIFDTLTGLEGANTGYGIDVAHMGDNEHEVPMLRWAGSAEPVIWYLNKNWTPDEFIAAFG